MYLNYRIINICNRYLNSIFNMIILINLCLINKDDIKLYTSSSDNLRISIYSICDDQRMIHLQLEYIWLYYSSL